MVLIERVIVFEEMLLDWSVLFQELQKLFWATGFSAVLEISAWDSLYIDHFKTNVPFLYPLDFLRFHEE